MSHSYIDVDNCAQNSTRKIIIASFKMAVSLIRKYILFLHP